MHLLLTIVTFCAVTLVQSVPPANNKGINILPIVECPDPEDSPFPQVIITPSIAGQDLHANQYVVCVAGKPLIFNCSEGLFFNWDKMSCDFPYEKRTNDDIGFLNNGTLENLIPAGPIQVPVSPELPSPIWNQVMFPPVGGNDPIPPVPITKPNPDVLFPVPVLPSNPLSPVPRPVPYLPFY